jgi:hypothetical protein
MSFDALTISGLLVALVSVGFLVGVVRNNDKKSERQEEGAPTSAAGPLRHGG